MNRMNSTFRNLATIIILIVLAAAAFWLVSQRAKPEFQAAAQASEQPPSPTASPLLIVTSSPSVTVTPVPPNPPFTPELVTGKVTIITPPPATPTIGPGPLAAYQINGPTYIALPQDDQVLGFLGFSSDGTQLLTYYLPESHTQPIELSYLAVSGNLTGQALSSQTVPLDSAKLQPIGRYPSIMPIRQLGRTNNLIYREQIDKNRFELKISNLTGQNPTLVSQITLPNFAISDDGLIAYVANNHIIISNPLKNNMVLTQLSPSNYGVDITNEYFGMALSPKARYLAIYDKGASLQIVNLNNGQAIQIHQSEELLFISEAVWSPDGSKLAYNISGTSEAGFPGSATSTLSFIDLDGKNHHPVDYSHNQANGDPASLVYITWSPDSQFVAMKSAPYMCQICQEAIVLISRDGKHFREIVESQKSMEILGWLPGTHALAYRCTPPSSNRYNTLCTISLSG